MDPISAMATASAAFGAIKKGMQVGRDIESMAGDLSRWMSALSDIDQAQKEAKNPPIFKKLFNNTSIEQEAITAFANKEKAAAQRYELQQWISLTLGRSKWDELVRMEGQIRKQRQETLYKQRERRQKFVEIVAWIVTICLGAGILYGFVYFLMSKQANAKTFPEYVVCRLKGCEAIDGERLCIYYGANNTVDKVWINLHEYVPKEIECKYDPKQEKPASMRETFEKIRESQK